MAVITPRQPGTDLSRYADWTAWLASRAAAVDQVRLRRVTGEWLVNRAIRRGHAAEAVDLFLADRIESLVPGATSASLDELSLRCYTWLDELLEG